MIEGIARGESLNRRMAIWIAVVAVLPLFLGVSILSVTRGQEPGIVALFLVPGFLILGLAFRLWRKPQGKGVSIDFTENGFTLKRWRGGDVKSDTTFDWADVRELRMGTAGMYGKWMEIVFTHAGALKAGLVRETTREDAPDLLVRRKIVFQEPEIAVHRDVALERMIAAAEASGFEVKKARTYEYLFMSVSRWTIEHPEGD